MDDPAQHSREVGEVAGDAGAPRSGCLVLMAVAVARRNVQQAAPDTFRGAKQGSVACCQQGHARGLYQLPSSRMMPLSFVGYGHLLAAPWA